MQRTVPEHSPLLAPDCVCHTCGSILKPQPIISRRGVEEIQYACYNRKTGCSYVTRSNNYLTAECVASRPPMEETITK